MPSCNFCGIDVKNACWHEMASRDCINVSIKRSLEHAEALPEFKKLPALEKLDFMRSSNLEEQYVRGEDRRTTVSEPLVNTVLSAYDWIKYIEVNYPTAFKDANRYFRIRS